MSQRPELAALALAALAARLSSSVDELVLEAESNKVRMVCFVHGLGVGCGKRDIVQEQQQRHALCHIHGADVAARARANPPVQGGPHGPLGGNIYHIHADTHTHIAHKQNDRHHLRKARAVAYNRPPLVFTTNEHYLEENFKKLLAEVRSAFWQTGKHTHTHRGVSLTVFQLQAGTVWPPSLSHVVATALLSRCCPVPRVASQEKSPPKDGTSAETLYLRWLAYRKVQIKVLVETTSKDLVCRLGRRLD